MGHYRADMYETEEDWKNRHKLLSSTPREEKQFRELLKRLCKRKPAKRKK